MTCRLFIAICIAALSLLAACSGADNAAKATWLHGTWQLSHNPQNDDEDDMVFSSDGKVVILTQRGEVTGEYAVEGSVLRMLVTVNGRPLMTEFRVSENKDKLIFHNGAVYSPKVP